MVAHSKYRTTINIPFLKKLVLNKNNEKDSALFRLNGAKQYKTRAHRNLLCYRNLVKTITKFATILGNDAESTFLRFLTSMYIAGFG